MACCKSCEKSSLAAKRSGLGKISKKMKGAGKQSRSQLVISAAKVGGGFVAGRIVKNIGPLKGNNYLAAGAQIVGGVVLASMSKSTKEIALGMIASGIVDLTSQFTGGAAANGLGLLPYSGAGSTNLPGVAGEYHYQPNGGMMTVG
jgi:hypothetical protein